MNDVTDTRVVSVAVAHDDDRKLAYKVRFFGRRVALGFQVLGILALLACCTNPGSAKTSATPTWSGKCAVTVPNGSRPADAPGSGVNHGDGRLWVALWDDGRVVPKPEQVNPDGSIDMKFGWWRGVKGKLTITGQRLDAPAPLLTARVPDGYGDSGVQSSGIIFPTPGCWEVSGHVGSETLTFITEVVTPSSNS
jgi:hypothetical protein